MIPVVSYLSPRLARLEEDFSFDLPAGRVTIPAGYTWDGATVPRIAWSIVGLTPFGAHDAASLKHDWLYGFEGQIPDYPHRLRRKFVDNMFFEDLEQLGFGGIELAVIKRFVRIGGYWFWREL